MYRSIVIVDDFYPDPLAVRARALALDYPPPTAPVNYPGRNSRQRLLVHGLDEAVSRLVDEPVVGNQRLAHGRCRLTRASDRARFGVHIDEDTAWAGVLYLNLPAQCRGGTTLFRHRASETERAPLDDAEAERRFGAATVGEAVSRVLEADANEAARWRPVMTLAMAFNRLVLFRPWLWHSAGPAFGERDQEARLVQLFFFVARPPAGGLPGRVRAPTDRAAPGAAEGSARAQAGGTGRGRPSPSRAT